MILYLTGIDGSGKTTILNDLEDRLHASGIETIRVWARYSPKLARIFVSLFKKTTVNTTGNYNTLTAEEYNKWQKFKKRITSNRVVKLFVLALFSFDYSFRIYSVRRILKKNPGRTILIDRFVIDFLVDQTVNLGDLSGTFVCRSYLQFCNQFDATFFISVDPTIAIGRKNDIPGLNYLIERDKAYRDIINNLKRGYIIDNNGPRGRAFQEIKEIIHLQ